MKDSETNIQLKFCRKDFEEIYFKNQHGNIFWSGQVKQHFVNLIAVASILSASMVYSLSTNNLWPITVFFLFVFIASLVSYLRRALPILKWKRQVIVYLNNLDKIKSHSLTLTGAALTLIQDDTVTIIRWVRFTKVIFNEGSISLSGEDECLFPMNSMEKEEYKYLQDFILDRLKNGR